jgi:hypothetical protein
MNYFKLKFNLSEFIFIFTLPPIPTLEISYIKVLIFINFFRRQKLSLNHKLVSAFILISTVFQKIIEIFTMHVSHISTRTASVSTNISCLCTLSEINLMRMLKPLDANTDSPFHTCLMIVLANVTFRQKTDG